MKFLNKLQNLPKNQKKLILWIIMVILAIFLFLLYIQNIQKSIKYISGEKLKEQLQIEELKEGLKNTVEF